jgi:hypothetical protein
MSDFSEYNPNDMFAPERKYIPPFRKQCIITINNKLIDPKGYNLREVPNRSYKIFDPVFTEEKHQLYLLVDPDTDVIYPHMVCVRAEAYDVIGEVYLFIRGYRVGHTHEGEAVIVVVEAQVKGGCHVFDDNGHIGGDGVGRWYAVLCPSGAESELVNDLKAEEARRREFLPKAYFQKREDTDEIDSGSGWFAAARWRSFRERRPTPCRPGGHRARQRSGPGRGGWQSRFIGSLTGLFFYLD